MNKALQEKINEYKKYLNESDRISKDKTIQRECKRLQIKLGIDRIEPKEYKLLIELAERMKLSNELNLTDIAKRAGYPEWRTKKVETTILRDINPTLFRELVGINRNEIEYELSKIIKQDSNLTAKNRAIELASKITGLSEPENRLQINIVNSGLTVSD